MKKVSIDRNIQLPKKADVKCLYSKRRTHLWSMLQCVAPFNIAIYFGTFQLLTTSKY